MMIGNAQRYFVPGEELEDGIVVPARVTEFECVQPLPRERGNKRAEPLFIFHKARWQLKQHRAAFPPKDGQTRLHQGKRIP